MRPNVTIFCPIYNDLAYVDDLMESVFNQTYKDFKFVILENGSTARTRSKLLSYKDPRIHIINSHINLRSETGSQILRNVDTEYLSIIFADDMYLPNRIQECLRHLQSPEVDACFSNNLYMWDDKSPVQQEDIPLSQFSGNIAELSTPEHLWHFAMRGNSLHPVSMMIKTNVYKRLGGFRPEMHQIGDMEFFSRLLLRGHVVFIEEPLQTIRLRGLGVHDKAQNESAITPQSMSSIRAERMNFLQNYRSPEALSIVDHIFLPSARNIAIPESMRLWYLGQQFINNYEPDYRFFGMTCLYDALKLHGPEIEATLTASFGVSPGAYIGRLTAGVFAGFGREDQDYEIARLRNALDVLTSREAADKGTSAHKSDVFVAFDTAISRANLEYFKLESSRRRSPLEKVLLRFARQRPALFLPGFDREYYLRNNDDVRRQRFDPLLHFLRYGWREGRDPSSYFSVAGYLNANHDVRAAHINPLLHFIEYGFREGRHGWQAK